MAWRTWCSAKGWSRKEILPQEFGNWRLPEIPWHRAWEQDAQPLQPGQSVVVEFDLMPTAYVFPAGHRIVLAITGADFRESDPLPAGETLSIRSTTDSPAYLDLPVVDNSGAP